MNLSEYRIYDAPNSIFYIPNFISQSEEEYILKCVYSVPKPKWTYLVNRRLQDYGGVPHSKGMIPEHIPTWLQKFVDKVSSTNIFEGCKPNQILVNEYLPGQGIMPHTDGPLFHPIVTTISCGSHTVLEFLENSEKREKVCSVLLEPCSLVVVKDNMYTKYLHSIKEVKCDITSDCVNLNQCSKEYQTNDPIERKTRVSLTIRNVPKVLKIKLF
ncbi:alpha-ketoglutarate-dependent dioxygenase alkB homolog 6 [Sitophilus oryzae]|uniref:Alpha-ketoglutarate-dependent dioxygenase alkB homolog 6 n=1 Tax=Sitophilus oryzae TaxID=7048 RepID=A0A6J2YH23_SITOR|nr:alpha-ketoglutarate-dependent dioxygenase alkB homolog 6 [Sitophilus oryzae]